MDGRFYVGNELNPEYNLWLEREALKTSRSSASPLYAYITFFRYYFDEEEDRYEKKNRINCSIPIAKWLWG